MSPLSAFVSASPPGKGVTLVVTGGANLRGEHAPQCQLRAMTNRGILSTG